MRCSLCGYEFVEEEATQSCRGCPFAGSCMLVRCPNCGYETPVESTLHRLYRKWRKKK